MKRQLRLLRHITCLLLCLIITVSTFPIASGAEVFGWDGKSDLKAGNTYIITDKIILDRDITVPSGTKLSVKYGGELKITSSAAITVRGQLAVAIGGKIFNGGTIDVKSNADLNVYGLFQSSKSAKLNVAGRLTVYKQGIFESSSAMKLYTGSDMAVRGTASFYKSSDATLSGNITVAEVGALNLRGTLRVSLSGNITVYGSLTTGALSSVKNSGKIRLTNTSVLTNGRGITNTKSGKFIDNRIPFEYENMTVDILVNEKTVTKKGIDVSYAQGEIDWEKVAAAGVEFAIIRAGRGRAGSNNELKEDDYFRQNIEGAQKYGIDVGVYFYSYASTVAEAVEEAEFYVSIIEGYELQYPVILDMEEEYQSKIGAAKLSRMIDAFFEVLMKNNYYPMFYSYKGWIDVSLNKSDLSRYAVWLAQVNDEVTYDSNYYMWQYSFTGKVDGIKGDVDLDYSYRDFEEIFRKYGLNNLK